MNDVRAEGESARIRNRTGGQYGLRGTVEIGGKRSNRPHATQSNVIAPIGPKVATSGIQSWNGTRVTYHHSFGVERKDAVVSAIDTKMLPIRTDAHAARIDDARVVAERTNESTVEAE
ncbi:hypothetical protein GNZ12_19715 [Paraburkholderia sp. 1N]|uniref:Uncharacterized protein n=1 Tax=Paraburkholderia solitsugae TaxID=2675748 RepID=A0ABX2BU20_9BURK|nr:hypothetical protein [Paraburkholderia solitsugae]NPT43495.1 hypothetical protein [Paraburkholderia solitsugae]